MEIHWLGFFFFVFCFLFCFFVFVFVLFVFVFVLFCFVVFCFCFLFLFLCFVLFYCLFCFFDQKKSGFLVHAYFDSFFFCIARGNRFCQKICKQGSTRLKKKKKKPEIPTSSVGTEA